MKNTKWIKSPVDFGETCPIFKKEFTILPGVISATLSITSRGVYDAILNDNKVGNFIMAPGWTSYTTRLQVQTYDITKQLKEKNELCITLGNGWYSGKLGWFNKSHFYEGDKAIIAKIDICYKDKTETISTDSTWQVAKSNLLRAEIYDGEICDARITPEYNLIAQSFEMNNDNLIPQEGEFVTEHERLEPRQIFLAPNGDLIIDFGQNLTGYVEFETVAEEGDEVFFLHAEILDKEGNFYRSNLRTAAQETKYICKAGLQTYKPRFAFMGFRYIKIVKAPVQIAFTAVVVHSQMKKTGTFECGAPKINKLYSNIVWGLKGNFLDIPTDCPQRDERLGWTGDAQVFVKTASYLYDVETFFGKWLNDLKADQLPNGSVPHVIPNILENNDGSAAWGDAAVICPWQIYLTYGNKEILSRQFESMKKWVEFSGENNRFHFGDWLALDVPIDPIAYSALSEFEQHKGNSNQKLISDAFNLYSTKLFIKAGEVLQKDMSDYKNRYDERKLKFQKDYTYRTQTEHVLALHFDLCENREKTAKRLSELVIDNGVRLQTGFVGTPYLLHVLSSNGYPELAYGLLVQEKYPSWLFSVNNGATTIWEHWDGLKEDGSITTANMNSYNHYAYGAVADWIYSVAAGINIDESCVAFENVIIKPIPDERLGHVFAKVDTKFGVVSSRWKIIGDKVEYEFEIPSRGEIYIDQKKHVVGKGKFKFEGTLKSKSIHHLPNETHDFQRMAG